MGIEVKAHASGGVEIITISGHIVGSSQASQDFQVYHFDISSLVHLEQPINL